MPEASPRGPVGGELTADYRPYRLADHSPSQTATIPLAAIRDQQVLGHEVRPLLRTRLSFLARGQTVLVAVALVWVGLSDLRADGWMVFAIACGCIGPVLAIVLAVARSLTLRQLRGIELVLFGTFYLQWALVHGFFYPGMRLNQPPIWWGVILGYAVSLPWVFFIIGYGILIPNTWRRCAAVVGVTAVTPLAISKWNGMAAQATAGHSESNYFFAVAVAMTAAAAIAVYGSHRIEVLRREAVAARRLGPYQLGRRLGAGGMGEVYLAEHTLLRRPCAVKLIRPDRDGDPAALDRFEREARATAELTHPNTVQVYDYGRADDGTFYYAMEYLPGLTLEEMVTRHGRLPPGRAIHFLRQVCGALVEAHAAGLVHRDIKPGNIMVCDRGGAKDVAKLLDFGLVVGRERGRAVAAAGTPSYVSPEQIDGRQAPDARTDLYSLGAVAFFLLTGRPPFPRPSLGETLAAHRAEPVVIPPGLNGVLPADVTAVVLRCLEKDPAARYTDAGELERAWAACAASGGWSADDAAGWWRENRAGLGQPQAGRSEVDEAGRHTSSPNVNNPPMFDGV